jgi:hypothetical protein
MQQGAVVGRAIGDPMRSFAQTAPDLVRTDPPNDPEDVREDRTVPRYPEAANPAD